MIHDLGPTRRGTILLVPILSALSAAFLVGCSGDPDDREKPPRDSEPSVSPSATSDQAKALEKQAEEALGIGEADDPGDLFVESGLERASDGIHTSSGLSNGRSYTLSVVCSGEGAGETRLTVTAKRPTRQTVTCDSVPVRQRIADAPAQIKIDVDGVAGSSGTVGWRIDELAR